jgi:AcrR family transcriptional regulator
MSRSTAEKHDKEQVILDAAARVFRRCGYARATLRDIAGEAGILLGSLQYRYMAKEILFASLAHRELKRSLEALADAREAGDDPLDCIKRFVFDQAEEVLSDESLAVWLVGAMALAPDETIVIADSQEQFTEVFDGLLREAIAAGQLRDDVPVPLLRNFLLGPLAWTAQRVFGPMPYPPKTIMETYWRLALEGGARPT